ncbi:MAG: hypothetical protein AAF416_20340 [Pseudomonadota bacterium]
MLRTLRRLFLLTLAVAVIGPIAVLVIGLEDTPKVGPQNVVAGQQAGRVNRLLNKFRAITRGDAEGPLIVERADIDGAIALGARFVPDLRGVSAVGPGPDGVEELTVTLSAPVPFVKDLGWYNLHAAIPESDDGIGFSRMGLGPIEIPAGWVVPVGAWAMNLVLGDQAGTLASSAIASVSLSDGAAAFDIAMTRDERNALAGRVKDTVRGLAFQSDTEDVASYIAAFDKAAAGGKRLGTQFAPHVVIALRTAADRVEAGRDARPEAEAMLFALGIECGTRSLQLVLGDVIPKGSKGAACRDARLSGRKDLRKHFAVSAALAAAVAAGGSFAVGEAKELIDSDRGSGFSFDDLMADRAGIRFAEHVLDGEPADWRALADRIGADRDILPEHRDLPAGMSAAAFERAYGDVESRAYQEMVREIDDRIRKATVLGQG